MAVVGSDRERLVVIGLDCAEPSLVFSHFASELPTFQRLMAKGFHGNLRSTDPPLTIPAWSALTTGKDAGELGCYGIRNRRDYQYNSLSISTSADIAFPRIWDTLARYGRKSIIAGVPQTFPVKPVNGYLIAGMLAPNTTSQFTWPVELKTEILDRYPDYRIDIGNFRSMKPGELRDQIFTMTHTRFNTFKYLLDSKPWDFAMMVEIGLDRLHHGFWHYWDTTHPLYPGQNEFEDVLLDYYRMLDRELSDLLSILPQDTAVLIVSDHGAQAMKGGLRINEWLRFNGHLELWQNPRSEQPLEPAMINWSRTSAWGEGGYFGRIFLNVDGREPSGFIPAFKYESVRETIAAQLTTMLEPVETACGVPEHMGNRVIFPDKHFKVCNGIAPDLMVYLGDLAWRSLGSVGHNPETFGNGLFTRKNDRGPDGANHDFNGLIISNIPEPGTISGRESWNILDVEPFIRTYFGIPSLELQ